MLVPTKQKQHFENEDFHFLIYYFKSIYTYAYGIPVRKNSKTPFIQWYLFSF